MNKEFVLIESVRNLEKALDSLSQPDTTHQTILDTLAQFCVDNFGAAFARVWVADEDDNVLILMSSRGQYSNLNGSRSRIPIGQGSKIDTIYTSGMPHLTNDVLSDPGVIDKEWAQQEKLVSFAGYPLTWNGERIGVVGMFARQPLSEEVLILLGLLVKSISAVLFISMLQQAEHDRIKYFCEATGFRRALIEQLIRAGYRKAENVRN